MFTIYIDSTVRFQNKVSLFKNKVLVDEVLGDIDLISSIKDLLVRNNLNILDIKNFDVNEGPGSFTGLKIGVTVANVLNWALDNDNKHKIFTPKYDAKPNIFKTPWVEDSVFE